MPVKHKFVSAKSDGGDATLIRPSNWNDDHSFEFTVTSLNANTTLTATHEVILATAGASGITLTLPTAVGTTRSYRIKRVDAGAGNVTIATTSSQTIDGETTYILVQQWQHVTLVSDGANWIILANN